MTLLDRLFAFLGWGQEPHQAPALPSAQPDPVPVPGVYAPTQGVPVHAVGDTLPPPANSSIPPAAITLLHHYESCAKRLPGGLIGPYLDSAGVATIGWGSTFYADGRRVTIADLPITQAQADALFSTVVAQFDAKVRALLPAGVDDDAHAACLSLAYNIGVGAFSTSTALRLLKAGDRQGAAAGLQLWNKAGGKVLKGLQRRRRAEALVLLGATAESAIAAAEKDFP
jgi:GH24 family phage-related lysozyme (muramidase)